MEAMTNFAHNYGQRVGGPLVRDLREQRFSISEPLQHLYMHNVALLIAQVHRYHSQKIKHELSTHYNKFESVVIVDTQKNYFLLSRVFAAHSNQSLLHPYVPKIKACIRKYHTISSKKFCSLVVSRSNGSGKFKQTKKNRGNKINRKPTSEKRTVVASASRQQQFGSVDAQNVYPDDLPHLVSQLCEPNSHDCLKYTSYV